MAIKGEVLRNAGAGGELPAGGRGDHWAAVHLGPVRPPVPAAVLPLRRHGSERVREGRGEVFREEKQRMLAADGRLCNAQQLRRLPSPLP
eukprot:4523940-Pleurochrysis_carterae.AAC.1